MRCSAATCRRSQKPIWCPHPWLSSSLWCLSGGFPAKQRALFLKDCSPGNRFVCMTGASLMGELSNDSIPTRASLLGRLKNWDDQASWEDFARTYSRLIRGFAIQSGLTEEEAREVEQETLLCVAKTIRQFESNPERGTFKAWLLKLTRWRIADQFRKRPPESARRAASSRRPDDTPTIERIPDDSSQDALW